MNTTGILICQLTVTQKKDLLREWVEYSEISSQLERCFSIIQGGEYGFVILPETCYISELESTYLELSVNRVIIAGSAYNDVGINETHIFENGSHRAVKKMFSSPKEVMEINYPNTLHPDRVIREWENRISEGRWPDYFANMPGGSGKKVAVLTCMDYYRLAYYLANSSIISPLLWGIASPCSNGQQDLFRRLAAVVHDSNEKIYSLIVNSRNNSRGPGSDQGGSFIYGPVTANVKLRMAQLGQTDPHPSAVCGLGTGAQALGMQAITGDQVTFFARSKDFASNPTHVKVYDLA